MIFVEIDSLSIDQNKILSEDLKVLMRENKKQPRRNERKRKEKRKSERRRERKEKRREEKNQWHFLFDKQSLQSLFLP